MIDVTRGSVIKHMKTMAIPSLAGGIAFTLFNITDTYFVGKLGIDALSAMGFTFPVVMIASSVAMGISTGAASVVSRLAGQKDREGLRRTATDGIILSILIVMFFSTIGLLTMDIVFPLLGADETTLPLVKEYMSVWYMFVAVVLMPPVSDGSMRALGDAFRPFIVMIICAVLNIILDPILIFGWFGFPALGIKGAAIATVISRAVGMIISLYFVGYHHKLITLKRPSFKRLLQSWQEILNIGIPSTGVAIVPQIVRAVLTATAVGVGGQVAAAAIAVGSRIEGFINMIGFSVSGSIIPIVGQNFGAKKYDRVEETRKLLVRFAGMIAGIMLVVLWFLAEPLANIFTSDQEAIALAVVYIRIMLFGAFGLNLYSYNGQVLNALGKSIVTLKIIAGGSVLVMLPLIKLGGLFTFGYMMAGLALGQVIVGIFSIKETKKQLNQAYKENEKIAA